MSCAGLREEISVDKGLKLLEMGMVEEHHSSSGTSVVVCVDRANLHSNPVESNRICMC